jgi:hypothetical protein
MPSILVDQRVIYLSGNPWGNPWDTHYGVAEIHGTHTMGSLGSGAGLRAMSLFREIRGTHTTRWGNPGDTHYAVGKSGGHTLCGHSGQALAFAL